MFGARVSLVVGLGSALIGGVLGLGDRRRRRAVRRAGREAADAPCGRDPQLPDPAARHRGPGGDRARASPAISVIVGIGFGAYLARVVYSQVVTLRERDFVLAARTAGVTRGRILVRHIMPHVMPSVIVFSTLGVATAIQLEAALSYVGLGIHPPTASWGNMIADGQNYMTTDVWLVLLPGMAIMFAMLGFSLVGDGMRDALDPTLERSVQVHLGGIG